MDDEINGAQLVTHIEASRLLGVSRATLTRIGDEGKLPIVRIDRLRRYLLSDISDFILAHRQGGDDS